QGGGADRLGAGGRGQHRRAARRGRRTGVGAGLGGRGAGRGQDDRDGRQEASHRRHFRSRVRALASAGSRPAAASPGVGATWWSGATPIPSITSRSGPRWRVAGKLRRVLSLSRYGWAGPETTPAVRVPTSRPAPRSLIAELKCSQAE